MADTVAELAVRLGVDASQLDAGLRSAAALLNKVGGEFATMAQQYQAAAKVISAGGMGMADSTLAQIGMQTTAALEAEIVAAGALKTALEGDAVATATLSSRQEQLYQTLIKAEAGAMAQAVSMTRMAESIAAGGNANDLLASAGVKTSQVIMAEVAALDRLKIAIQGDDAAIGQLVVRQDALLKMLAVGSVAASGAAAAMGGAQSAEEMLAAAGIKTTAAIQQEIKSLQMLMNVAGDDAIALAQLRGRMDMLTRASAQMSGQAGSASFAVISLGQGFQDAGQFGMGMAQGIRAVTNNLQMSVQAMMMLTAQAGGAKAAMQAFWTAMKGPAGFLLAFGAATAIIEGIANASQKSKDKVKELGSALKDVATIHGEFAASIDLSEKQIVSAYDESVAKLREYNAELARLKALGGSAGGLKLSPLDSDAATEAIRAHIAATEKDIAILKDEAEAIKRRGEVMGVANRLTDDARQASVRLAAALETEKEKQDALTKAIELTQDARVMGSRSWTSFLESVSKSGLETSDFNSKLLGANMALSEMGIATQIGHEEFSKLWSEIGSGEGVVAAFVEGLEKTNKKSKGAKEELTDLQKAVKELRDTLAGGVVGGAVLNEIEELGEYAKVAAALLQQAADASDTAWDERKRLDAFVAKLEEAGAQVGYLRSALQNPLFMEVRTVEPKGPSLFTKEKDGSRTATLPGKMPKLSEADKKAAEEAKQEWEEVAFALRNGVNEELKQTHILLNTMPLTMVDELSGAIGDAAGQILTLQGGFDELGKNLVKAFQNIVAEMIGLIIKQKLLNALKMQELATTQAIGAASAAGGAGGLGASLATTTGAMSLGTMFGIAAGVGVLSMLFKGGRDVTPNEFQVGRNFAPRAQGGGMMAVRSDVLKSGDLRLSIVDANARSSRIGQR